MNSPKKILLVEDNRHDQYFFVKMLSEIENATLYNVAHNGMEALQQLKNSATLPDLIFTDIHMPLMNGIECLTEIKKNPHTKDIPVVVLSSDIAEIERVRLLGAKAFIKKESDCQALRKQIEQLINLDFVADSHIANQTFQNALLA